VVQPLVTGDAPCYRGSDGDRVGSLVSDARCHLTRGRRGTGRCAAPQTGDPVKAVSQNGFCLRRVFPPRIACAAWCRCVCALINAVDGAPAYAASQITSLSRSSFRGPRFSGSPRFVGRSVSVTFK
jgi:hypothetical protein